MIPPLSGDTSDAVDRALDLLRIRLLAAAAQHRPTASAPRCHSTGTSKRRGTAA